MTSLLAFFVLICVLVFVHEYGHFWAARRCGVKVLRFSIGFGKVLWRRVDKQGTEFAFSLIPLGGYVQMAEENEAKPHETLSHKSVWQRIFIVAAGPLANFIFAVLAFWAVYGFGIPTLKPVVGSVEPNSIAAQAGVLPEFEFKRVDGKNVQNWEETLLALVGKVGKKSVEVEGSLIDEDFPRTFYLDLSNWSLDDSEQTLLQNLGVRPKSSVVEPIIKRAVENSAADNAGVLAGDKMVSVNGEAFDWLKLIEQVQRGNPISLTIEREGTLHHFSLLPEKIAQSERYQVGIVPVYQPLADKYRAELKYDMLTALQKSVHKVASLSVSILQFIGNLISGDLSLKNVGGPISMAKGAGATAEIGAIYYLNFMALISVNLAVLNLLPILPLDGGRLLLLGAEAAARKPLPEKAQLLFQQLGIIVLFGLMAFALVNDLIHF